MIDTRSHIVFGVNYELSTKEKKPELFVVKPESIITNDIFEKIIIV